MYRQKRSNRYTRVWSIIIPCTSRWGRYQATLETAWSNGRERTWRLRWLLRPYRVASSQLPCPSTRCPPYLLHLSPSRTALSLLLGLSELAVDLISSARERNRTYWSARADAFDWVLHQIVFCVGNWRLSVHVSTIICMNKSTEWRSCITLISRMLERLLGRLINDRVSSCSKTLLYRF